MKFVFYNSFLVKLYVKTTICAKYNSTSGSEEIIYKIIMPREIGHINFDERYVSQNTSREKIIYQYQDNAMENYCSSHEFCAEMLRNIFNASFTETEQDFIFQITLPLKLEEEKILIQIPEDDVNKKNPEYGDYIYITNYNIYHLFLYIYNVIDTHKDTIDLGSFIQKMYENNLKFGTTENTSILIIDEEHDSRAHINTATTEEQRKQTECKIKKSRGPIDAEKVLQSKHKCKQGLYFKLIDLKFDIDFTASITWLINVLSEKRLDCVFIFYSILNINAFDAKNITLTIKYRKTEGRVPKDSIALPLINKIKQKIEKNDSDIIETLVNFNSEKIKKRILGEMYSSKTDEAYELILSLICMRVSNHSIMEYDYSRYIDALKPFSYLSFTFANNEHANFFRKNLTFLEGNKSFRIVCGFSSETNSCENLSMPEIYHKLSFEIKMFKCNLTFANVFKKIISIENLITKNLSKKVYTNRLRCTIFADEDESEDTIKLRKSLDIKDNHYNSLIRQDILNIKTIKLHYEKSQEENDFIIQKPKPNRIHECGFELCQKKKLKLIYYLFKKDKIYNENPDQLIKTLINNEKTTCACFLLDIMSLLDVLIVTNMIKTLKSSSVIQKRLNIYAHGDFYKLVCNKLDYDETNGVLNYNKEELHAEYKAFIDINYEVFKYIEKMLFIFNIYTEIFSSFKT